MFKRLQSSPNKTINAGMPDEKFKMIYKNIEKLKCLENIFLKL